MGIDAGTKKNASDRPKVGARTQINQHDVALFDFVTKCCAYFQHMSLFKKYSLYTAINFDTEPRRASYFQTRRIACQPTRVLCDSPLIFNKNFRQ